MFHQLCLQELWIWFGTGQNQHYIPIHELVDSLGPRHISIPLFHSITGCDQVSFFAGRGKKASWKVWNKFEDLTNGLRLVSFCPSKEDIESILKVIERFVVLLYDCTSIYTDVSDCRKELFSKKGRPSDGIPPTQDALRLHIYRATYQAAYCWAQSLRKSATLPNPSDWGWRSENGGYEIVWTTIPEASKVCKELIRCGCDPNTGCRGRCKCVKASLPCTELCKCGGKCKH